MSELKEVNTRLDNLITFLREQMVTKQELAELKSELPSRDDFSRLQTSVDGIAREYKTISQELTVVGERTSRMEGWIMKAAAKLGLDYRP